MNQWRNAIQQLYNMGLTDLQIARLLGVKVQKIRALKLCRVRKDL